MWIQTKQGAHQSRCLEILFSLKEKDKANTTLLRMKAVVHHTASYTFKSWKVSKFRYMGYNGRELITIVQYSSH